MCIVYYISDWYLHWNNVVCCGGDLKTCEFTNGDAISVKVGEGTYKTVNIDSTECGGYSKHGPEVVKPL